MKTVNVLYILSNGRVAAINKKDGSIVWEIKLKEYLKSSVLASIGQITIEGDKLYVGVAGLLFCLATKDGSLLWKNELKGWGYSFVSMANANNDAAGAAQQAASMQAATSASMVATTSS